MKNKKEPQIINGVDIVRNNILEIIEYLTTHQDIIPMLESIHCKDTNVIIKGYEYFITHNNITTFTDDFDCLVSILADFDFKDAYYSLHQDKIIFNMSLAFSNIKKLRVDNNAIGNSMLKFRGVDMEFTNFENVSDKISVNTSKFLWYLVLNLNLKTCISYIDLNEYAIFKGISDKITANREVIDNLLILNNIKSVTKMHIEYKLIEKLQYNKRKGYVKFDKNIISNLINQFTNIPKEVFKLKGNTYKLALYIYQLSRINKSVVFSLSIETCLSILSLPSHNECNRCYKEKIIEPFETIIDDICEKVQDINITPDRDFIDYQTFKKGKLLIKINNDVLKMRYEKIKNNRKFKNLKSHKKSDM